MVRVRTGHTIGTYFVTLLVTYSFFAVTPAAAKEDLLQQQLKRIQKQTEVGAVSYALVENDNIIATGGIGTYALDDARPVTENSRFRVGSITKTFTAVAVMHLIEQSKLRLDQALKNIARDLPLDNPWPKTPVTLEMLLEHTAGLQDLTREEFDYPVPLSLEQAFKLKPEARKLQWQPGYHYSYTNVGAGYTGRVIETVTGEDYDNWFEREILGAMGMRDSQLHWTKALEESLVTGYDADLKTEIPYWHTLFRPFGGLNTTARDMANFLLLFTNESKTKNQLISASNIEKMETPKTSLAARAGLKTGYGLGLRNTFFKGHRIYGHGGDGDGYLAEFAYSKETHRGYFIAINAFRHDLLEDFTEPLNDWLIGGLEKTDKPKHDSTIKPLSKNKRLAILGDYQEITVRFPFNADAKAEILRVKLVDEELYRCFPRLEKCTKILPITEALFRTDEEPDSSMALIKAEDGCLYLQTGFGNYRKIREQCTIHE